MQMNNVTNKVLESNSTSKSGVRSVFLFQLGEPPNKHFLSALATKFKLLKVLDLQDAPLDQLHKELGYLFHLQYLSVKSTEVKIIPESIANLHNLQTLNLKFSLVSVLPFGINTLHKLRHLIARSCNKNLFGSVDYVRGVKTQGGFGHLVELQTLDCVEASHENASSFFKELENFTQLRKLGIRKLKREHGKALCVAIEKMKHLKKLRLRAASEDEVLDLQFLSSPPECLQDLRLGGRLEKLLEWIPKLQNLVRLSLFWSGLTGDAIKALQALPNLLQLRLFKGYDAEQLNFEVGGFHKLKLLSLEGLKGLNSIIIEEGALPHLKELLIGPCPQVKEVPSGIRHLRELTSLEFVDMPTEFLGRMQVDKGPDYWIVKHIPNVNIVILDRGDVDKAYTLREFREARETQRLGESEIISKLKFENAPRRTQGNEQCNLYHKTH